MKARILDGTALRGVTPGGLAAYAQNAGWAKTAPYGDAADVWQGEGLPEILLPNTDLLGDYPSVVARLIGIFSEQSGKDEIATLKDLLEAEHDVIRVRAIDDGTNGSVALDAGVEMVSQARGMVLAAACATVTPAQRVYRAWANKKATGLVKRLRLGQTEHGSFVVALMAPIVSPVAPVLDESWGVFEQEPPLRRVIIRLVQALQASREMAELWDSDFGYPALDDAVSAGVSANLCDALARLVGCTNRFEVSVAWATTDLPTPSPARVEFSETYRQALEEAAKTLRSTEAQPGARLTATVHALARDRWESRGKVTLKAEIRGRVQSVTALLQPKDYGAAIHAHQAGRRVIVTGDLERIGQRWHIANARLSEFGLHEDG